MRSKIPMMIAATALALTPVGALADASDRTIELHIQATGEVTPDRLDAVISVTGYGKTKEEAETNLKAGEQAVIEALTQQGVNRAKIKIRQPVTGYALAPVTVATVAPPMIAPAPPPVPTVSRGAAPAPTSTKVPLPPAPPVMVQPIPYEPPQYAQSQLTVELTTPEQMQALQGVRSGGSSTSGYRFSVDSRYSVGDPAKARREARAKAIAKARAEADDYAAALGYRVVRIVRASNAKPGVSLDDVIGFVGMVDRRTGTDPKSVLATVRESVTIDFELAPN